MTNSGSATSWIHRGTTTFWTWGSRAAGLRREVVGGPDDRLARVEVARDLGAAVGVVAQRDRVDAVGEQLVGELGRDPQPAGDVLAVDDDERGLEPPAQLGQQPEQRAPAEAADHVADEQDGWGAWHVAYSGGLQR